jgi:hypothetical protein
VKNKLSRFRMLVEELHEGEVVLQAEDVEGEGIIKTW